MLLRALAVGTAAMLAPGCVHGTKANAPTVIVVESVKGGASTAPAAEVTVVRSASWDATDEVEVVWHGNWWPAVVVERRAGRWLVHYQGYGSDWDEVVGPDRIRERQAELKLDDADEPEDEPDP